MAERLKAGFGCPGQTLIGRSSDVYENPELLKKPAPTGSAGQS